MSFYWTQRVDELNRENEELKAKNKAYFDALAMIIAFQPGQKVELSTRLIATFNPSRFKIEQTENLLEESLTLKLKELNEYGNNRGVQKP